MSGKDERRRLPRQKTRLAARVLDSERVVDCIIKDKSAMGARLLLAQGASVPAQFHLLQLKSGELFEATLVWTSYPECGVAFRSTVDLSKSTAAEHIPFKKLWVSLSG
jgi:hypothetical protein